MDSEVEKDSTGTLDVKAEIEKGNDWFLQDLVRLTNDLNLEIGITLNASGQTISGLLISGRRYFDIFAEQFSGGLNDSDESKEQLKKMFQDVGSIYDNEEDAPPMGPPQYIHLINAKMFESGGSLPSQNGVLWRGKLNAISGFSLGVLS
jgi:hypothetical protein